MKWVVIALFIATAVWGRGVTTKPRTTTTRFPGGASVATAVAALPAPEPRLTLRIVNNRVELIAAMKGVALGSTGTLYSTENLNWPWYPQTNFVWTGVTNRLDFCTNCPPITAKHQFWKIGISR